MTDINTITSDREKLENQISAIREARKKYVDGLLAERGRLVESVSKITGTPGKPELVTADYTVIEQTFNRPIAELKERLRLKQADEAKLSIPALENQLDTAQGELDKVRAEVSAALAAAEGKVKGIEGKIHLALMTSEQAAKPNKRVRFEPLAGRIDREYGKFKQQLINSILNY